MKDTLPDPPRWKEATGQASLAERTAGETVRAWGQPEPLPPAALARVAVRLRGPRTRRVPRLLPVAAALLLGIATAASAAHLHLLPSWLGDGKPRSLWGTPHDSPSVRPSGRSPARGARALPAPTPPPSAPAEVAPPAAPALPSSGSPLPAPSTLPTAHNGLPMRGSSPRRTESVARPPAATPEPLVMAPPSLPIRPATVTPAPDRLPGTPMAWLAPSERRSASPVVATDGNPTVVPPAAVPGGQAAKQLAEAIRLLRSDGKAEQAMALLDAEATSLRREGLGHEALILRVEALLVLGRSAEALRWLDGTSLSDVAASHALLVARGKLRASANRCADAIGDFTLVLAESHGADRDALFGRAVCRHQLGDRDGAREDLERYRREFPADPRLPALERRLGGAVR